MRYVIDAYDKLVNIVTSIVGRYWLRVIGIQLGKEVFFAGLPIVSMVGGSSIEIGDRVTLCSKSNNTALGVNHPIILRTMTQVAHIFVGQDVGISGASICAAKQIIIGAETMLGANVIISDTDFHSIASSGRRHNTNWGRIEVNEVCVGKNVFIGANSIVLKGVRIGDNSVIGAGSVVISSIPENVIAAGNPCRVIRSL